MNREKMDSIIERTSLFQREVASHVARLTPEDATRYLVAFQAAVLSIEHAAGSLLLIGYDLPAPAYALMRSQYECLVRGIWLLYSASDIWVEKLAGPLTLKNAERANEGLGLSAMLKQLEISTESPKPIIAQLMEYKKVAWKALSSFTHGGIHPLSRARTGYPAQLTFDVIRNSNGVVHLACQLSSILTGDLRNMAAVRKLTTDFADCLPILPN